MTADRIRALTRLVRDGYEPAEFPALAAQIAAWQQERPLAGACVLDATPVFRNTLAKHLALLAAGADLIVAALPALPSDPRILDELRAADVPVVTDAGDLDAIGRVDVACDCAGVLAPLEPRCGAVELTRSGVAAYAGTDRPVVVVDDSRLKLIETSLGTGDGFVRGMRQLGHSDFAGRSVVVFGAGKVGRGVASASRTAGALVMFVDSARSARWESPDARPDIGVFDTRSDSETIDARSDSDVLDAADGCTVAEAIAGAWCVVTATGVAGAAAQYARELCESDALLANMGVEDEYGSGVPAGRVLNGKAPLNFALAEPTRLRYLDPVFGLSNVAVVQLLRGDVPSGISTPRREWEEPILAEVLDHGALGGELRRTLPHLH